jgi:hypothetical protein
MFAISYSLTGCKVITEDGLLKVVVIYQNFYELTIAGIFTDSYNFDEKFVNLLILFTFCFSQSYFIRLVLCSSLDINFIQCKLMGLYISYLSCLLLTILIVSLE